MNGTTAKPGESAILDHAQSPYHRGRAPNASCVYAQRNAACGDWVRLELVLEAGERVQQAWFDGGGCLISQAAASILCQAVEGKTIGELRELTALQMLDWLEIPLTPRRMQCGLLTFKMHWVSPGRMREGMRLVVFAPKGEFPSVGRRRIACRDACYGPRCWKDIRKPSYFLPVSRSAARCYIERSKHGA